MSTQTPSQHVCEAGHPVHIDGTSDGGASPDVSDRVSKLASPVVSKAASPERRP